MSDKTPISEFEAALIATVNQATFVPNTGPKRFIRDCASGHITQLTPNGRWYLAFVAHRFRRQYQLTSEQWQWINERLNEKQARLAI